MPNKPNREVSNSRRKFLGQAACAAAGGLLTQLGAAADDAPAPAAGSDVTLPLSKHAALDQVGGYEIIVTPAGRVIVAHTDAKRFVACSAICTHRNTDLEYDHDAKQFVCPRHGSTFSLDGKHLSGPARRDLKNFPAEPAAVVNLKPPTTG